MALPSSGYDIATISNPTSALTDFSLIVDLSNMTASWWAAVDTTDGTRGRASKADGVTELACDWIDFDSTAETGILRVLYSGTLASSGTQQIRIYPPMAANPSYSATDTYGQYNAYGSNWAGYWPDAGITDRTGNQNNGTAQGGVVAGGATGILGSGTDFDGIDDYISIPDDDSLSLNTTNGNTWMAWFQPPATITDNRALFAKYFRTSPFDGEWYLSTNATNEIGGSDSGSMLMLLDDGALNRYRGETNTALSGAQQNHIAWTWDGTLSSASGMFASLDGSGVSISELESNFDATANRSAITTIGAGLIGTTFSSYTDGIISEVQFHSVNRSAEWITQEYSQTYDNATFWGTWTWVSSGGNTYSVECSDGINLSDSISSSSIISAILSDGMTASDSPTSSINMNVSLSDSVAINDAVSTFSQIHAIMSELATFADSATTEKPAIDVLCSDSIRITDSTESSIVMQVVCPDGIVLSDFAQAVAIIASSCSDGASFTDTFIDSTFLPQGVVTITGYSAKLKITFNVVAKPAITGGNA